MRCGALLLLCSNSATAADWPRYNEAAAIPRDARGRLERNWVVTGAGCERTRARLDPNPGKPREGAVAGGALARLLKVQNCAAVCLTVGAPVALVAATADLRRFDGNLDAAIKGENHSRAHAVERELDAWYDRDCGSVELGFISYGAPARIFWVHPRTGERHLQRPLTPGDGGTVWLHAGLGHRFVVIDDASEEVLGAYEAQHDAIHAVVPAPKPTSTRSLESWKEEENNLKDFEQNRANNVLRTWTKRGYDRAPLPAGLFADIATYWYNNAAHCLVYEEWASAHVNWWESASPEMCYLPFGLKRRWHDALKPLVEQWIGGVELDETDLYGIRRYARGSKLMPHVDREETHAASVIVNIGQYGLDAAWPLQIYDLHTEQMTNVTMQPGELLFYESARCLHGREAPFQGEAFVSLFAHYRPRGDPGWFREEKNDALDWASTYDGALPYSLGDAEEQIGSTTRAYVEEASAATGEL